MKNVIALVVVGLVLFINSSFRPVLQQCKASDPEASFQVDKNHLLFVKKQPADLASDYEDTYYVIVLASVGRECEEVINIQIVRSHGVSPDSFEIASLSNRRYFYYEAYYHGGNMGNYDLEFALFDILSEEAFVIKYIHLPEGSIVLTDFKQNI